MDKIMFRGMEFYAYHGVFAEEKKLGQPYTVDLEVYVDLHKAGQTDQVQHTVDYAQLYEIVHDVMANETYDLIEAVAERIAGQILGSFARIEELTVRVTKPSPPIAGHYDRVAVEITRKQKEADQA